MMRLLCPICGEQFSRSPTHIRTKEPCCSVECSNAQRRITRRGDKHPRWNGGRRTDPDGYILIWTGRKTVAGSPIYEREHRLVMEKALGRKLKAHEIVHHINEDPADNRLENLQLTIRRKHQRTHRLGKRNGQVFECHVCGKPFYRKPYLVIRETAHFCSRICSNTRHMVKRGA